jgi:hypothetical protein
MSERTFVHSYFSVPLLILLLNWQIPLRCFQSSKARGPCLGMKNLGLPLGKANQVDRTYRQDVLHICPG